MAIALRSSPSGWNLAPFLPAELADDRVRVRIEVAGLCRTDVQAMEGSRRVAPGRVLGHEAAGTIERIPNALQRRAATQGLMTGQRVAFFPFLPCGHCFACRAHLDLGFCTHATSVGLDVDGAFASTIDLPLEVLVAAPENLSFKHLAYAEPVAAAMGVWDVDALQEAKTIAIIGRGRIAELTRRVVHMGHPNVAMVDPDDDILPDYFDVVIETWPTPEVMEKAARMLRPGGTLILKSRPAQPVAWPHQLLTLRRIRCQGAPYGSFQVGLDTLARGDLVVDDMLGPTYAFTSDGIAQALDDERQGNETQGKLFFGIGSCAD